ncbi:hypothetical protein DL96DRAFT_1617388 [Flagelloscypha sp. PMI_526]|nr:hypothetical protein DL96DRAFT_1617388 [Flagelloscypha sp. PMI_526]
MGILKVTAKVATKGLPKVAVAVPKVAAKALPRPKTVVGGATIVVKHFFPVLLTKPFPPLPVDLVRTICELAAGLDRTTMHNLSLSSKEIRTWLAPTLFQHITVYAYSDWYLQPHQAEILLSGIAPYVQMVSTNLNLPSQIPIDTIWLLEALPNLTHIRLQANYRSPDEVFLPRQVCSLETRDHFPEPSRRAFASSTRARITHIYSELDDPPSTSLFSDWNALTHLCFKIRNQTVAENCITNSTFPISAPFFPLPASIVSCILIDSFSNKEYFQWSVNQALLDLVRGDIDSRIVLAVAITKEQWTDPQGIMFSIRSGLQDALLYHGKCPRKFDMIWKETIWDEADEVRKRRVDPAVRRAVSRVLQIDA